MTSASSIVSIFALVFWSFQLAPQAYLNFRRRSTVGLSPLLLLSWSLGSAFTGVNAIVTSLSPLFIVQPNLFLLFSLLCYAQCHFYPRTPHSPPTPHLALLHVTAATAVVLALELGLSLGLQRRRGDTSGSSAAVVAVNVLALVGFVLGFAPQYWVIWRMGRVAGVSRGFLLVDMTGALLSTVALALTSDFQGVEAASYIAVFVLDGGILALSFVLPAEKEEAGVKKEETTTTAGEEGTEAAVPVATPLPSASSRRESSDVSV